MEPKRNKPPALRTGLTHEIEIGGAKAYVTLNHAEVGQFTPCEIFVVLSSKNKKTEMDSAHQGWANLCMTFASMLLQYGCPLQTVAAKMIGYRFEPDGGLRGAKSIPDAIGKWLRQQLPSESK